MVEKPGIQNLGNVRVCLVHAALELSSRAYFFTYFNQMT